MAVDTSISGKPTDVFKTFPKFSKLTLGDRKKYESFIAGYPPVSDITFPTLMLWWNMLDSCAVAQLNGNLVISYWLPGLEEYSGLSLAGTKDIDETLCTIFDSFKARDEQPRVVHVSEFVIANIQHPDLFICTAERAFDEYVYPISNFFPLNQQMGFRRSRVKKFTELVGEDNIIIKSLDMSMGENRRLLTYYATRWQKTGYINDLVKIEQDAINVAINNTDMLGIQNLCLYISGELQGFCLFQQSADKRYIIMAHARINMQAPRTLDYAIYAFSQRFADMGASYLNLECDLGSNYMRTFKVSLGPCNYFRKYTIEPAV